MAECKLCEYLKQGTSTAGSQGFLLQGRKGSAPFDPAVKMFSDMVFTWWFSHDVLLQGRRGSYCRVERDRPLSNDWSTWTEILQQRSILGKRVHEVDRFMRSIGSWAIDLCMRDRSAHEIDISHQRSTPNRDFTSTIKEKEKKRKRKKKRKKRKRDRPVHHERSIGSVGDRSVHEIEISHQRSTANRDFTSTIKERKKEKRKRWKEKNGKKRKREKTKKSAKSHISPFLLITSPLSFTLSIYSVPMNANQEISADNSTPDSISHHQTSWCRDNCEPVLPIKGLWWRGGRIGTHRRRNHGVSRQHVYSGRHHHIASLNCNHRCVIALECFNATSPYESSFYTSPQHCRRWYTDRLGKINYHSVKLWQ